MSFTHLKPDETLLLARVSQKSNNNEKDGGSFDQQISICSKELSPEGFRLVKFTKSGYNDDYLNEKILPLIEKEKIKNLVCYSASRFCRNFINFVKFINGLKSPLQIVLVDVNYSHVFHTRSIIPIEMQEMIREAEKLSLSLSVISKENHKRKRDFKTMNNEMENLKVKENLPDDVYEFEKILTRVDTNPVKYQVQWSDGTITTEPRSLLIETAKVHVEEFERINCVGRFKRLREN